MIDHIPTRVTSEDNTILNDNPTVEEINKVVLELNNDNANGLDGFIGHFYQIYWDIIERYVVNIVEDFFNSSTLFNFIAHTNLILLPKKEVI